MRSSWGALHLVGSCFDYESLLPAFASLRDDGSLAVMVINKDPDRTREVMLRIEGFRPAGPAQVWLQAQEHLAAALPAITAAGTFSHAFPPYSVTLFVLSGEEEGILSSVAIHRWVLWGGVGLVAVALAAIALLGRRVRR